MRPTVFVAEGCSDTAYIVAAVVLGLLLLGMLMFGDRTYGNEMPF